MLYFFLLWIILFLYICMQILFSLGPQEHAISPSSSLMKQIQMQQQSQMQFQYSLDSEEQLRACSMQDPPYYCEWCKIHHSQYNLSKLTTILIKSYNVNKEFHDLRFNRSVSLYKFMLYIKSIKHTKYASERWLQRWYFHLCTVYRKST